MSIPSSCSHESEVKWLLNGSTSLSVTTVFHSRIWYISLGQSSIDRLYNFQQLYRVGFWPNLTHHRGDTWMCITGTLNAIYEYLLYNLSGVYSMHRTHPSSSCPICHNPFNKRGVFTQMHNLVSTMVNQMILINIHTSPYPIYPDLHQTNWGRNHIGLRLKHVYFYQGPNGCSVCFSLPITIYYVQQTWKLNGSFI